MWNQLNLPAPAELSLYALTVNLILGATLAYILRWFYIRFGTMYSNRRIIANNFPLMVLTTTVVISIVKSSLALSLGLVGALSIVRFRTAIKEPEELSYLFLSIAVGLGLGADQRIPTLLSFTLILSIVYITSFFNKKNVEENFYLNFESEQDASVTNLKELIQTLARKTEYLDLRRFDSNADSFQATFFLSCKDVSKLEEIVSDLRRISPKASITFVDQSKFLLE